MFNLILSTPTLVGWEPSVRLFFSPYSDSEKIEPPTKFWAPTSSGDAFPDLLLDFPTVGAITTRQIELPSTARLQIGITKGSAKNIKPSSVPLWAGLKAVGQHDTLTLTSLEPKLVVGNVLHSGPGPIPAKNCVARCADGSTSHGCVVCTFEDVTIKICC